MTEGIRLRYDDEKVVIESTDQNVELSYDELHSLGVQSLEPDPRRISEKVSSKLNTDVLSEFEKVPDDQQQSFLGGVALRKRVESRNAVMLDSTTFKNSVGLLRGELRPTSLRFFDLKSFVNALVLFDRVYVTSDPDVDEANDLVGETVFERIRPDTAAEDDFLYYLWGETIDNLRSMPNEKESGLKRVWAQLLNINEDDVVFDWSKADRWVESPPNFYRNFNRRIPGTGDLKRFISLSTFRTFYSHELARRLGLKYLPNSARGPVEQHILSEIDEKSPAFDTVINEFERKLSEEVETIGRDSPYMGKTIEYELPMFLSVVVNRADDLDETFRILSNIREEATPYREKAEALTSAIDQGNLDRMAELQDLLGREATELTSSLGSAEVSTSLEVTPDVPLLPESGTVAIAGLKLMSGYPGKVVEQYGRKLYLRIRKPHYYFLTNVRQEARHFTSSRAAIEKLWGEHESIDFDLVERAQEHYPYFT